MSDLLLCQHEIRRLRTVVRQLESKDWQLDTYINERIEQLQQTIQENQLVEKPVPEAAIKIEHSLVAVEELSMLKKFKQELED